MKRCFSLFEGAIIQYDVLFSAIRCKKKLARTYGPGGRDDGGVCNINGDGATDPALHGLTVLQF